VVLAGWQVLRLRCASLRMTVHTNITENKTLAGCGFLSVRSGVAVRLRLARARAFAQDDGFGVGWGFGWDEFNGFSVKLGV
jgi:hypothetical protein